MDVTNTDTDWKFMRRLRAEGLTEDDLQALLEAPRYMIKFVADAAATYAMRERECPEERATEKT